jgi:hypothetical protein
VIRERVVADPENRQVPSGTGGSTEGSAGRNRRVHPFKKRVGCADHPGMDLPGTETEHQRPRRRLVVVVVLAFVALGSVGVNAWAFGGHDTPRVVASPTAAQHPAGHTAHASSTTPTVEPVSTTTVIVVTTVPSTTTSLPRYVPPPTAPTTRPAPIPPTTAAPTPTTVATTARLHITPSTAGFPSTPPPYWPMPIVPVTITNTGGVAISSIVVHPVGVYSIPSNSCTTTLMPGQSCGAQVQFCPNSPGHYLDTLLVTGQYTVTRSPLQASITLDGTAT